MDLGRGKETEYRVIVLNKSKDFYKMLIIMTTLEPTTSLIFRNFLGISPKGLICDVPLKWNT